MQNLCTPAAQGHIDAMIAYDSHMRESDHMFTKLVLDCQPDPLRNSPEVC